MLSSRSILITGGTGSFGKSLTRTILKKFPDIKQLIIYSQDESGHDEMARTIPSTDHSKLRFLTGDVRDRDRLTRACEGIHTVIHAAALKRDSTAESSPE